MNNEADGETKNTEALLPVIADLGLPEATQQKLRAALRASKAESTWRAYFSEWRAFERWCKTRGAAPLPASPDIVAAYVLSEADRRKVSGLRKALASIQAIHKLSGQPPPGTDPRVRAALEGLARQKREVPRRAAALRLDDLERMIAALPQDLSGARDRAVLLVGFFGAFRRSEVAKLRVEDVEVLPEGIVIRLWTKTRQSGEREEKEIAAAEGSPMCPVGALAVWREGARIASGPLFRGITAAGRVEERGISDALVNKVVKRAAAAAGLGGAFSGHSLRAGLVTELASAGASDRQIMGITGHRDPRMVATYARRGRRFENNAVRLLVGKPEAPT